MSYSLISIIGLTASLTLFKTALDRVLKVPMSFFDTTPTGRIISRLSKDQDTLDGELPMMVMQVRSPSPSPRSFMQSTDLLALSSPPPSRPSSAQLASYFMSSLTLASYLCPSLSYTSSHQRITEGRR